MEKSIGLMSTFHVVDTQPFLVGLYPIDIGRVAVPARKAEAAGTGVSSESQSRRGRTRPSYRGSTQETDGSSEEA